jgi:hypothetical protein
MIRWIPWGDGELEVLDTNEMPVDVALDRVQEAIETIFTPGQEDFEDDLDDEEDFDEDEEDEDSDSSPSSPR